MTRIAHIGDVTLQLPPSPLSLARWVEARVDETVGFAVPTARLFGLEVVDPGRLGCAAGAARLTFLAELEDPIELVAGAAVPTACQFDAAVLMTSRWMLLADELLRPAAFPRRRRARVVTVVSDDGTATAGRYEHQPEHVALSPGLGACCVAGTLLTARWRAARS